MSNDRVPYRLLARDLAAVTLLGYLKGSSEHDPRLRDRLIHLDCFLFESVCLSLISDRAKAEKLVNAYVEELLTSASPTLAAPEFVAKYKSNRSALAAAWKMEFDPKFLPASGVKAPVASVFLAQWGLASVSNLILVERLVRLAAEHWPTILVPLVPQILNGNVAFDD
jgi:hypothetical protein